jgi:hypothetical protein
MPVPIGRVHLLSGAFRGPERIDIEMIQGKEGLYRNCINAADPGCFRPEIELSVDVQMP